MVDESPADLQLDCNKLDELDLISKSILDFAGSCKIWLFYGDMGSGKTTLIKSICAWFGVIDIVTSPTFSIVNEYLNTNDEIYYHFDFYRITNVQEAVDIGCEEYFYSGKYCFIEWPKMVESMVPENHIRIDIINRGSSMRMFELKKYE